MKPILRTVARALFHAGKGDIRAWCSLGTVRFCTLFKIGLLLSWMRGTNVRLKLLATFRLIPLLHFIDCSANWVA